MTLILKSAELFYKLKLLMDETSARSGSFILQLKLSCYEYSWFLYMS